jgi:hypothetical protein
MSSNPMKRLGTLSQSIWLDSFLNGIRGHPRCPSSSIRCRSSPLASELMANLGRDKLQ